MTDICKICTIPITKKSPGIQCRGFCGFSYHCKCVNITVDQLSVLKAIPNAVWNCPNCQVAPHSPISPSVTPISNDAINVNSLLSIMKDIKMEIKDLKCKQDDLLKSVSFCSDKVSDFEIAIAKVNDHIKIIEELKTENNKLKGDVSSLNMRLNELEQYSRANNLEIQGVHEKNNENLFTIIEKITNFLGVKIDPNSIESIHRVQSFNRDQPKNIIVKFLSIKSKNQILTAAKTKRASLRTVNRAMSIEEISHNLYLNDHLTNEYKLLYKKTREIAKNKGYKYVWLNNCNIFVRKDDGMRVKLIKNVDHLNAL